MDDQTEIAELRAMIMEQRAQIGAAVAVIGTLCEVLEIRGVAARAEVAECIKNTVDVARETPVDDVQAMGLILAKLFLALQVGQKSIYG